MDSYVLFSIGNLEALFEKVYPHCWGGQDPIVCDQTWVQSVQYLEVVGIIIGQVLVGIIGDWLGRRWGLLQDCAIMLLGLIMLTAAWGVDFSKLNCYQCRS